MDRCCLKGNLAKFTFSSFFTLLLTICVYECLCILCHVFYCNVSDRLDLFAFNKFIDLLIEVTEFIAINRSRKSTIYRVDSVKCSLT